VCREPVESGTRFLFCFRTTNSSSAFPSSFLLPSARPPRSTMQTALARAPVAVRPSLARAPRRAVVAQAAPKV
jgi:hypothetical protein